MANRNKLDYSEINEDLDLDEAVEEFYFPGSKQTKDDRQSKIESKRLKGTLKR
jgi:hypothetical protein